MVAIGRVRVEVVGQEGVEVGVEVGVVGQEGVKVGVKILGEGRGMNF